MTRYLLGQVPTQYNEARIIDGSHFATVAIGNPSAVTIGSAREATFDDAVSHLGVTAIRWPGGSEAERSFDWRSDSSSTHALDISDLRNAIDYCADNGLSFSFTFPTAEFRGMSENEMDTAEVEIVGFINDFLEYADQRNVVIDSIKIGNEYDLNGLSAEAYGQIASRLSGTIGEALHGYESPNENWNRPDLVIESGRIWLQETQSGLFFGDRDHNGIMDAQEIMDSFNTFEAGFVDAIDIHSMTLFLSSYEDYFGEGPYSTASLNTVYDSLSSFWGDAFNNVELQTLAWQYPWRRDVDGPNEPGGVEDHGGSALSNASLGFMHYYEMSLADVGYAASWIAAGWGGASPTLYHNAPRAGGEVFRLLQENISGLRAVEFEHDPSIFENDSDIEDVIFRAFEQSGNVVLYIGNLETELQTITIDDVLQFLRGVSGFDSVSGLTDYADLHVWGTRLGVDGDPSDARSATQIDIFNIDDLLSNSGTSLEFDLGAHEIMQLSFTSSEHNLMEMRGSEQDDILMGRNGDDMLSGGGNSDWLIGENGADRLYGGAGEDNLRGNSGDDRLYGENGDDNLRGASGEDVLHGGIGNDNLFGGIEGDRLYGDEGSDALYGENGNDQIYGGTDNDWLMGGSGADRLYGGNDADNLRGGIGNDTLHGEQGDDNLRGAGGQDLLDGGSGHDLLSGGSNSDQLYGSSGNDTLYGENGNDRLYGGTGIDWLIGGNGADRLYGSTGTDNLRGGGGNDTLHGQGDEDNMRGGTGDDILYGGSGIDTLYGGTGSDRLNGGSGNDVLFGGNGNDILHGDGGDDTMTGGYGNDRFVFNNNSGNDVITDFDVSGTETIIFSNNNSIRNMTDLEITYGAFDTMISFGNHSITLEGTTEALQNVDFIF